MRREILWRAPWNGRNNITLIVRMELLRYGVADNNDNKKIKIQGKFSVSIKRVKNLTIETISIGRKSIK